MQDSNIAIGAHQTIDAELTALQNHITEYRAMLNDEGVWLFLATLGCLGAPPALRLIAFSLVVIVFGDRLTKRSRETRSFSKLAETIHDKISAEVPEGDQRKALLYDLLMLKSKEMSGLKSFTNTRVFLLCWLFFGASFLYCVWHQL